MNIVALCGGLGTRLRPLFFGIPKVLVPIGDKTFVDLIIENLLKYDITDIILCTGYLGEQIEEYFQCQILESKINLIFSHECRPLGTGGAIKNIQQLLTDHGAEDESFLVLNFDSICNINYNKFMKFHKDKKALVSMVLSKSFLDGEHGNVQIDNLQKIITFDEKELGNDYINAGIYLMNKEIFDFMSFHLTTFSLEHDLFPRLVETNRFYGYITDSQIIDIGTPERYRRAIDILSG